MKNTQIKFDLGWLTSDSKAALLRNYQKASFFRFIPRFSFVQYSEYFVVGLTTFRCLDDDIKTRSHVVLSPRDLLKINCQDLSCFRSFTLDFKIYSLLNQLLRDKIKIFNFSYYIRIFALTKARRIIIKSTVDPVSRIWLESAGQEVKSACVQHGIFSSTNNINSLEYNVVNTYFYRGESQRRILEEVFKPDQLRDVYERQFRCWKSVQQSKISICLIGSDHERYGEGGISTKRKIVRIYLDFIKRTRECTFFNDVRFLYKLHPSESCIPSELIESCNTCNTKEFLESDFYIGVSSTMLLDLAAEGKRVFQISHEARLKRDRYESFGGCRTINHTDAVSFLKSVSLDGLKYGPCLSFRRVSSSDLNRK